MTTSERSARCCPLPPQASCGTSPLQGSWTEKRGMVEADPDTQGSSEPAGPSR
jgi:hypothetical protein